MMLKPRVYGFQVFSLRAADRLEYRAPDLPERHNLGLEVQKSLARIGRQPAMSLSIAALVSSAKTSDILYHVPRTGRKERSVRNSDLIRLISR